MLRHALREDVPPNAVPGFTPELLAGVATSSQGLAKLREAIEAAKAGRRWQKSVKPVLDILVTFSHQDGERLSKADQDDYLKRALAFVQERFGGAENVLAAAVHRDESTAHVQILMLARERGGVKLGCSQFMGNRGNLHKLQNDFWQACGKPFGLQRGEPRTGAKHLPIRQLYGALAAGAEVPTLMEVPIVTLKDRLVAPEKLAQRDRAIQHNKVAIEQLRALAQRGKGLHPDLLAQQAERYRRDTARRDKAEKEVEAQQAARYRRAAAQIDKAEKEAQEATKKAQEAAQKAAETEKQIREMERCILQLDQQIEAKAAQAQRLNDDIDNLRRIRDLECGNDYGN